MRIGKVIRSFKYTIVNISVYNVEKKTVNDLTIELPKRYKTENEVKKAIVKMKLLAKYEKVLAVNSIDYSIHKYSMTEDEFIKHATEEK